MSEEKEKPLTREDVLRLIEEKGGTASGLDLSGKTFEAGIHLNDFDLELIILEKARFAVSFVRGPITADVGAQLQKAKLMRADLQGASLRFADLQEADLSMAKLTGADLSDAHLEGARLYRAQFDNTTNFQGVSWGDYKIGEELDGKFNLAVDAYRRLKQWYTNAGMYGIAAKFYYREREAGRKGAERCNDRAAGWFTWALFGHGEGWKRILFWIAGFILLFALVYFAIGTFAPCLGTLTPNTFLHNLYYSAVSFTALGYGSWAPQPTGWIKGLGAFEALFGISMMALLLVTFVRKWTR